MKKVKCIRRLYINVTKDKVYDVINYEYVDNTYLLKIRNDNNVIMQYQMKFPTRTGMLIENFQDVTMEYRDGIIDEILS